METQEIIAESPKRPLHGFGPLQIPLFRDRWIASTVSNLGTWMQDTAGTWLMTVLSAGSPLLIALMQTAASLPVLLLGLLAGATADIFERRRLLIFWQSWMLVTVGLVTVLTFAGVVGPYQLLALTFLMNIGAAMNNPAWQAIVPELVPREQIPDAVSLNSASNNLARALGPALGGLMVAAFVKASTGAGWVFALNSASFAAVIWVLWRWKRKPLFKSALPAERMAGSIRSGLRYLRFAPELQASLIRAFLFTFFVSAVWALLAAIAARELKQGAMGYGLLNGAMGAGAVVGALLLPRIRARFDADSILRVTSVVYIAILLVLAWVPIPVVAIAVLLIAGFCWTSTMSTLNTSVQLVSPAWVQARALGAYLTVFQGGLALGSAVWGYVAEHSSVPVAMTASAIGLAVTLPFALRFHILQGKLPDLGPYVWRRPARELVIQPELEDGPVRIVIEYFVAPEDYAEFTRLIHKMENVRLRTGAIRWGVFRDAANPERMEETFVMESWLDHLRARERMTAADAMVRDRLWELHKGEAPPHVEHQLYVKEVTS
ncbi:MFS transporter [Terriglobus albidus]|uniref:MFS transporter n=1 Tax=Terriglobus albidus TaxID=1592106 RepID=UPI0021DF9B8C|nr:MFS transporter [Terriglobus albidus]